MHRLTRLTLCLLSFAQPAVAGPTTVTSHSALALAALVAANSPVLTKADKKVMAALFQGQSNISYPAGKTISIQADEIACLAGNLEINFYSCNFTFGKKTVSLSGRSAHEMFATLAEVGAPSDSAMGKVGMALTNLSCTIDPNAITQESGGGADCQFAGPGG